MNLKIPRPKQLPRSTTTDATTDSSIGFTCTWTSGPRAQVTSSIALTSHVSHPRCVSEMDVELHHASRSAALAAQMQNLHTAGASAGPVVPLPVGEPDCPILGFEITGSDGFTPVFVGIAQYGLSAWVRSSNDHYITAAFWSRRTRYPPPSFEPPMLQPSGAEIENFVHFTHHGWIREWLNQVGQGSISVMTGEFADATLHEGGCVACIGITGNKTTRRQLLKVLHGALIRGGPVGRIPDGGAGMAAEWAHLNWCFQLNNVFCFHLFDPNAAVVDVNLALADAPAPTSAPGGPGPSSGVAIPMADAPAPTPRPPAGPPPRVAIRAPRPPKGPPPWLSVRPSLHPSPPAPSADTGDDTGLADDRATAEEAAGPARPTSTTVRPLPKAKARSYVDHVLTVPGAYAACGAASSSSDAPTPTPWYTIGDEDDDEVLVPWEPSRKRKEEANAKAMNRGAKAPKQCGKEEAKAQFGEVWVALKAMNRGAKPEVSG